MDRSDVEDNPQEGEIIKEGQQEKEECPNPLSQLDFYQANPFASCQSDHELFNEDIFPKADISNGFGSDPFKGSDPFAADILFPETNIGTDGNTGDEADTSLSCAENKASTGTQCFESEFPDEDSDIENSYSQEEQDVIGHSRGFKPIQSSSEELGPEPIQGWRSQGQYSVESDPNGYELDLGAISPPSDIEEHSLGCLAGEATPEAPLHLEQGLSSEPAQAISEQAPLKTDWTGEKEQSMSQGATSGYWEGWSSNMEEETQISTTPHNSQDAHNFYIQPDLDQSGELSFDLSYEATSQSSFDPYGFKLSPEHSSHTLLDPDEAELSPEPSENYLAFDTESSSSQTNHLNFNTCDFDLNMSQKVRDSDPYGFKLSPEDENQEVLDVCGYDDHEAMDPSTYDKVEPSGYCNQEVLESNGNENQEVLDHCGHNNQKDSHNNENQEVLESSYINNKEIDSNDNKEFLDHFSHDNQEVVKPYLKMSKKELLEPCNQEVLEPCSLGNKELLHPENQEVPDLDSDGNQELLDFDGKGNQEVLICGSHNNQEPMRHGSKENQELLDLGSRGNQEVLDLLSKEGLPEANNNQCFIEPELSPTNNSSDSDVAIDLLGLELSDTSMCTTNNDDTINISANHNLDTSTSHILEGDLGSVFRAGGYIGCPDVADDLQPLGRMQVNPVAEAVKPVRPVRPPRPSLKVKEKALSQTQGIDLK
ncbi:hypothetical protein JOB18_001287 [Solea senegalensis]|uniref:Uncharacterized protein n=2 Tax=Solea senegalensis TaxID=28829 RepID=A0AAV6PR57_SOLSE|nr:hypothetical protein JOB18_001287 [Solea senegalensis]KAG7471744.1 hypothetical protein JOB18_001287 [Solea senegalensis]